PQRWPGGSAAPARAAASGGAMTAPQTLMQAALSRLGARLGSGLVDAAANLALLAQDAPEKARQELELFWQEVRQEAERLEREQADTASHGQADAAPGGGADLQDQIDALRARVAALSRRLDQRP
ncbi:hypothetical protein, partial [Synechococcus sp. GFB01]|uniref:hypothetical protein n=1 Tax=Synechococcus sp. GFB01 TaxID=1662190 RepID=UPI001F3D51FF